MTIIVLLGLIATPNSPIGRYNPPPASQPPPPPIPPPPIRPPTHPLIRAIRDNTVVVKKVAQNPAVLAIGLCRLCQHNFQQIRAGKHKA